jgi:hypothetical protein
MQEESKSVSSDIAKLNDKLRSSVPVLPLPHVMVLTKGVRALSPIELNLLFFEVRAFSAFTKSNNYYGENDFGVVTINQEKFFWKFDYYSEDLTEWKENGRRVLTLMRADEY